MSARSQRLRERCLPILSHARTIFRWLRRSGACNARDTGAESRTARSAEVPEVAQLLRGRVVLVTGAAGSIGRELCRQIVEYDNAQTLVCLDKDESGLVHLEERLRRLHASVELEFCLGDIKDRGQMEICFKTHWPNIVFHAAAYKNVSILQRHPLEAARNNVVGTRHLVDLSDRYRVGVFVLISTDRAVNPSNVMGATKRTAEQIVRARDLTSTTRFCSVRFGDTLDTSGSAIDLFLRQIREHRAVTLTHPDVGCHVMTIAEAVQLVLLATTMGEGGEVFILDTGQQVKLDQLARSVILLSGLTPDVDVPIVYTGLPPGEKLKQELWTALEKPRRTSHPGILVARGRVRRGPDISAMVTSLLAACDEDDLTGCWDGILSPGRSYAGRTSHLAAVPPDEAAGRGDRGWDSAGGDGADLGDGGEGRDRAG